MASTAGSLREELRQITSETDKLTSAVKALVLIKKKRKDFDDSLDVIKSLRSLRKPFADFQKNLEKAVKIIKELEEKSIRYSKDLKKCAKFSMRVIERVQSGDSIVISEIEDMLKSAKQAESELQKLVRQHNDVIIDVKGLSIRAKQLARKADDVSREQFLGAIPVVSVVSDAVHGVQGESVPEQVGGFFLGAAKGAFSTLAFPITIFERGREHKKYEELIQRMRNLGTGLEDISGIMELNTNALANVLTSLTRGHTEGKVVKKFISLQRETALKIYLQKYLESCQALHSNCVVYLSMT